MAEPCPVCSSVAEIKNLGGGPEVDCPRCGHFKLSDIANELLKRANKQQRANLSGWIRENKSSGIDDQLLASLFRLKTPPVAEKADKLLLFLSQNHPKPGEEINLSNYKADYFEGERHVGGYLGEKLYSVCWCQDDQEFDYILHSFSTKEKRFFKETGYANLAMISPSGWAHLQSLTQERIESTTAFVAMWFDKSIDSAWMVIEAGIRNAGYEPLRIDRKEHNNKIDDEIVAGIRRSKFLVADFTGHRGGVYFEAGLASGLGLPVIWLCRKNQLKKTHFDTRQYNFIVWEDGKLDELSKALKNRIEATIGHGPLTANALT